MTTIICVTLLLLVLVTSMAAGVAGLAELYELHDFALLDDGEQISGALALLVAVKATLSAWLFWLCSRQRASVAAFSLLAVTAVALGAHHLVAPALLASGDANLVSSLQRWLLGNAAEVALSLLVAAGHLGVSASLFTAEYRANGYRLPLAIGGLAVGGSAVLAFIDTMSYLAVLYFDLTLLLFAMSTWPALGGRLTLATSRTMHGYVLVGLGLPVAIFIGHKLVLLVALLVANQELIVSIAEERSTDMKEVVVWESPRTYVKDGAELVRHTPILNDAWFLDATHAYGVDCGALYESHDGGRSWRRVRRLRVAGVQVRFSADGERGWTGDPVQAVEITRDGGASWSRLRLDDLHLEKTGERLGDGLLTSYSRLHLDPESGHGAVVLECVLYTTRDFALSWRSSEIRNAKGKRICLADTPLAIDPGGDLAVGSALGSEILYRRDPVADHWERRCGLDEGAMLLTGGKACEEDGGLSVDEQAFLSRLAREDEITGRVRPGAELLARLLADRPLTPAMRASARSSDGDFRWLAAPGLLATSGDAGEDWTVVQHVPELRTLHPWSAEHAVGWDEWLVPYRSSDGGGVWRPIELPEGEQVVDLHLDPAPRTLWLLLDSALQRVDLASGEQHEAWRWRDEGGFEVLRATADGQRIWLYSRQHHTLVSSNDAGRSWRRVELASPLADGEEKEAPSIVDVLCHAGARPCVVLLDDGRLRSVALGEPPLEGSVEGQERTHSMLPEQARGEPGFLLAHGASQVLLFMPEQGRLAYSSDEDGIEWREHGLGARRAWSRPRHSGDGSAFIVPGEDGAVVVGKVTAPWTTVLPSEWGERLDFCWSRSGRAIYLSDGANMAWTLDGGASWRRTFSEDALAPFCGFGGDHLWLQLQGMRVYRLPAV